MSGEGAVDSCGQGTPTNGAVPLTSAQTMSSSLPLAIHYHNWIFSLFRPYVTGSVLEIGFGYGQYSGWIAQRAQRLLCVDLDETVAMSATLPSNASARQADLSVPDFPERAGNGFDLVVCLNVLEHIQDDALAMRNIAATLNCGGRAFVLVPAFQLLYGEMDRLAGHCRRYSTGQLRALADSAGLIVEKSGYLNAIGGLGWLVNAKLSKPKTLSDDSVNAQILFFDRYVLPFSRLLNPLFCRIFGQSAWVLLRAQ